MTRTTYRAFVTPAEESEDNPRATDVVYILLAYTSGQSLVWYTVVERFSRQRPDLPVDGKGPRPIIMRMRRHGQVHSCIPAFGNPTPEWLQERYKAALNTLHEGDYYEIARYELPGGSFQEFIRVATKTQPVVLDEEQAEGVVEQLSGAAAYNHD